MAKRRPAPGRPAEGPHENQVVSMLTRVSPETKRRLDQERELRSQQDQRKISMTQLVETLLKEALAERGARRTGRDQRARALGYLVTMMADAAEKEVGGRSWASDPYTFKMLQCAIDHMLIKLTPEGTFDIPERFRRELEQTGPHPSDVTRAMLTDPEWTAWYRITAPLLHSLGKAQAKYRGDQDADAAARLVLEKLAGDLLPPLPRRSTK